MDKGYAHPEVLKDTEWVAAHLTDPQVVLLECNEDPALYEAGHIPGARELHWTQDLNDEVRRDFVSSAHLTELLQSLGVANDSTLVLYGDRNNWWACYAFWVLQLRGVQHLHILDGGRQKWLEEGRELTRTVPTGERSRYQLPAPPDPATLRALRDEVLQHTQAGRPLVDVRSPAEYWGELLHMPDYPQEGALRGGHIPHAKNIPWARAAHTDGTFKSAAALRDIYEAEQGLAASDDIVTYCRIGERSSHTWFVLAYLLGYPQVRNYDGSWTEWGNAVGVPIER